MPRFIDIMGGSLPSGVSSDIGEMSVLSCSVDDAERSVRIALEGNNYINENDIRIAETATAKALSVSSVLIEVRSGSAELSLDTCLEAIGRVSTKNAILGGYFNGAEYNLGGGVLNIALKYGGLSAIKAAGFEAAFNKTLSDICGKTVEVEFSGVLDSAEMPEVVVKPREKSDEENHLEEILSAPPKDGLPVYLETAKLFYGRRIDTKIKRLQDIVPPDNPQGIVKIAAFGQVFGLETKDIVSKRGKPMVIVKFAFSDGTNSFNANMFVDAEQKASIKPLKNGAWIVVNGDYAYDEWSKDFIVRVNSLATVKKYTETDNYEGEKRIELHLHTNMSAKDAVSSATDMINLAASYGHKAVAITDHGVVQAYPEAAAAAKAVRKSGKDFKLIYGVEAYYADDTVEKDLKKLPRHHMIMLVKDLVGLKNLYKIVSNAHLKNFYKRPVSLKSVIDEHRDGLIIGSACEQGELYKAIIEDAPHEELLRIAKYYDFLEIQPLGNNEFMLRKAKEVVTDRKGNVQENPFKNVTSIEVIKNFNRKVVEIADELGLPVVATGDVHFARKEDVIIRKILQAAQDYSDFDMQAPLYLKTTEEMLADFDYFGERAREFVIDNPHKIAAMISDDVIPVPEGNYPPVIEGSDEELHKICWERAMNTYGFEGKIPEVVEKRLEKELNSIINNGFSIMYMSAQKLVKYSEDNGYLVGSRGSVGSSFAATMAGISEVNPLPPHYYCPKCRHNEFFLKGEVGSGFDLPEKNCPKCGTTYKRDGHNIPFETFLGFKGDKVPDIDLNFSDEFQTEVQKYTETLFGSENVFKAGTISTIAEKTAFGFAKAYAEKKGIVLSNAELGRLASMVEGAKIKATTGQHPAGMIVVPRDKEIYDFCPVQHPADDVNSDVVTTHFDFHSIHDTILKLDELGHVVPTTYKYLEEYSGIPVSEVSMSDEKVYSLFVSPAALGVTPEAIDSQTGTFCLPEMGTKFVREMLIDCQPKNFSDLLQISGLSHGTDVWLGNAKDLIDNGTCTISEVIGTRDNIMVYLIQQGMEEGRAFKITETVRKGLVAKGKVSPEDWGKMEDDMRAVGVPEWYIKSCYKIKYMFPKAHAAAYVIAALRLAWYKVYRPLEFYCAYFTARPEDVDVPVLMKGKEGVKSYMDMVKAKGREASKKETDVFNNMLIFNEMLERGIEILPIDIKSSHAVKYVPENGKMRLPFGALSGVGERAAWSLYEAAQGGDFISKDEFQSISGASKTVIAELDALGAFGDLPDSNQISMF